MAAAALLAVSACSSSGARAAPPEQSSGAAGGSDGTSAAAVESAALISALGEELRRASRGTARDSSSPTKLLRTAPETYMFGDPALTRTGWWTVPLPYDTTMDYLDTHAPAGMREQGPGTDNVLGPGAVATYNTKIYPVRSVAYPGAEVDVIVQWIDADHTAVRADTYLSPRGARAAGSYVRKPVTSVGVTLRVTWYQGGATRHAHGRFAIDQAERVDRVVRALNRLPGKVLYPGLCVGGPGPTEDLTLTLHTADGAVVVQLHAAYTCQPLEATVFRAGAQQGPVLDAKRMTAMVNTWVKKVEEAKE